jgi:thiosulfate/3-mercaptopyruvate sulfurtransferase
MLSAGCGSSVTEKTTIAAVEDYTDSSYIIGADSLNANLGQSDLVILDPRSPADYAAGHIPGAINVSWKTFAEAPYTTRTNVLGPEALGPLFSAIGIDASKTVVVYADPKAGWGEDGRFVWMLRMAGVKKSKMLNGGYYHWKEVKGYDVTTTPTPAPTPASFSIAALDLSYSADTAMVQEFQNNPNAKIIDARTVEERMGPVPPLYSEAYTGYIPASTFIAFYSLFKEDGTLKSAADLTKMFTDSGVKKGDDIITYCTSGIRSAQMALVLRMLGFSKARNYNGSLRNWEAAGLPLVNYADKSFTVEVDWLSRKLKAGATDLLILDARPPADYAKGHIPGAVNVKWQDFSDVTSTTPGNPGWGAVLPPALLSAKLSAIGVTDSKTIVVYAGAPGGWGDDGRITWVLRMAGIAGARMLNGGFEFWKAQKYDISTWAVTPVASSYTVSSLDVSFLADMAYVSANLATPGVKIVDSRAGAEYQGATLYGEARGGHIPGAIRLPFDTVFNKVDYKGYATIKDMTDLDAVFSAAGLKKTDIIIVYCTAGIRSAHMTLALRMAGYSKAINYAGSFYEWAGNPSMPVEK